ncbi:MAG: TatD family hydrolase [Gammaproteobacteria bacterium]|nr:TatD family hydrolase [Gammaproteobacteria bacterium]MDH5594265.1 TatD family hydrolase [Gammaproteobacteria bacterium]MDH5614642.1 TatD family hydrolase [Gammaproteobacteria bacterium]
MELIDTHCHLDVDEFDNDRDTVLACCRAKGIHRIVVPAIDREGWDNLVSLCGQERGLYPALGLHPVLLEKHKDHDLVDLEKYLAITNPVAVGEIGLDFYIKHLDQVRQKNLFNQQLAIARNTHLPVLLHVRKAHDETLMAIKKSKVQGGIAHAFNGSLQQAEQYIELGFKLGFGGTMTYEKSSNIRKLAKELPLESIVLETDAPDMVVEGHHGERNSPEYLIDCLNALAEIRNESPEFIAEQTTKNACDVLNLSCN